MLCFLNPFLIFQVFASIGHWNTSVLVILALHLLPVWGVALTLLFRFAINFKNQSIPLLDNTMIRNSSNQHPSLIPTCACLLALPPALMTLAAIGILVP